jgi:hypothetical protein
MSYSYKADLERQYAKARSRAVALRAEKATLEAQQRACCTTWDHAERSQAISMMLSGVEREMAELRLKLGLPEPGKPIKINVTAADRAAYARQQAQRARVAPTVRKVPSYVTKVITPEYS